MYDTTVRSHPYFGIKEPAAGISREIIRGADLYHKVHAARLARTAELLIDAALGAQKLLEIGTSGFIPMVCDRALPDLEVHATHFDKSYPLDAVVPFTLGGTTLDVRCFCVDLEYDPLPAADETYDIVTCCEVLEHMEIDPMFMLSEVNRVLKPGGTLILTTPNITSSRALKKILDGYEPYFYMQYHKSREYHRHNYEYSAPTLAHLLSAAGFSGKIWSEDLFEDGLPAVVEKLRLCGFPVTHHGDNLLAVVTKMSEIENRFPYGIYV